MKCLAKVATKVTNKDLSDFIDKVGDSSNGYDMLDVQWYFMFYRIFLGIAGNLEYLEKLNEEDLIHIGFSLRGTEAIISVTEDKKLDIIYDIEHALYWDGENLYDPNFHNICRKLNEYKLSTIATISRSDKKSVYNKKIEKGIYEDINVSR